MSFLLRLFGPSIEKVETTSDIDELIAALNCRKVIFAPTHYEAENARAAAARRLGEFKDPRAIEPLIAALKDVYGVVCRAATVALGQIGDARAVEPLITKLEEYIRDDIYNVRRAAAVALGQIGDARAVKPLIAKLQPGNEEGVRQSAAEALVQIGAPSVRPLIEELYSHAFGVSNAAKEALVQIGAPSVQPLIAALKYGKPAVALTLGQIGDARAVEPLIASLKDGNKWAAATALGQIGDARAVEPLIAALKDDNVRHHAAKALGQIGDARAIEPLIAVLKDNDSVVRSAVAEALGQIGDARAVKPLIPFLHALGPHCHTLRVSVANALIKMYQSQALDQAHKSIILAQRSVIVERHVDDYCSSDCTYMSPHSDSGIGISFPDI